MAKKIVKLPTKKAYVAAGYKAENYDTFLELEKLEAEKSGATVKIVDDAVDEEVEAEPEGLDPKYQGDKSYQLTEKHYRDSRMYEAGERITVTDEKPGKTWRPIEYSENYERVTRQPPLVSAVTGKPETRPSNDLAESGLNAPATGASDRSL